MSGPAGNKASGDPARKPIGVFVLDDHEIVRQGVRALLEAEPDIRVIGEAIPHRPRWPRLWRCAPMWRCWMSGCPMGTGCRCAGEVRVRLPGVAWLMFISFSDDEALLDSILAGAAGYVLKQIRALICPAPSAWPPPAVRCCLLARRARWWPGCGATLASPARWPR